MPVVQELTPERIAELQRMTPQQKLKMAEQMFWDARRAKAVEVSRLFLIEAMKEG